MKARYYLDTSVYGGYFDDEFKVFTRSLFERIALEQIQILYSTVLEDELQRAPARFRKLVDGLNFSVNSMLFLTQDVIDLAHMYIDEGVVGSTSFDDCLHIALATLNNGDLLVSWNFRHIVNIERIRGYNSVNLRFGYKTLEIRSPRELLYYGN